MRPQNSHHDLHLAVVRLVYPHRYSDQSQTVRSSIVQTVLSLACSPDFSSCSSSVETRRHGAARGTSLT